MGFASPWALIGLIALPLLWWLHRRARPRGDRVFSAFFLVSGADADGERGGRLRAPWLLAARMAAVAALVVAAAGPTGQSARGVVVIATGPLPPGDWLEATIIRAGRPPSVVEGETVAPVLGPPDLFGALALAEAVAPGARRVFAPATEPPTRIDGAGAALDGDAVVVSAALTRPADGPRPRLRIGDATRPLTPRPGDHYLRGALPPGPALITLDGAAPWPLCIPDASPLRVAEAGWPPAVEAVLDALPHVVRVPAADAEWRPGVELASTPGRALFAPAVTGFTFADRPTREAAPLWFAADLPPPGAVARRWRPLRGGEPILHAADEVVVDRTTGLHGATRRFGFDPADTDLIETAGWPVLWLDALDADRSARGRCVIHRAGRPLRVAAHGPVAVLDPLGRRRVAEPHDGVAVIDGLDALGHATLTAGGVEVHVAVVPDASAEAIAPTEAIGAIERPPPPRRAGWFIAAALLLAAVALGGRRALAGVAAALAIAGLVDVRWGTGRADGQIVVAVDASGSMPAGETLAAADRLAATLGETARWVTAGRDGVRVERPRLQDFGGPTAHRPLLAAAAREAGEGGAIVLLSDGRAPDGPAAVGPPVFAVPVRAERPDARVVDARALRLGDRVFARATLATDQPVAGELVLGEARVEVALRPDRLQTVQAVQPDQRASALVARVEVAADRQPANDSRPIPIEGDVPPEAVVVGAGAASWATAAGLVAITVPAAHLAEAGSRLAQARAMWIHDQPAGAVPAGVAQRIRHWVAAGGVLVLSGRTRAFGPGGWRGTPLDELSPLRSDPRPPGVGRVGAALLLDRSGSIASEAGGIGTEGIGQLAGAVAAGLRPIDRLAVLGFGGAVEVLLPPTALSDLRPDALPVPTIARGGTRLAPALDRARALLGPLPVEVRVAVLVGDGRVADGEAAIERAAALAAEGIRVLAVLVGVDPDPAVFTALADATDGAVVRPRPDALRVDVAGAVHAEASDAEGNGGPVAAEAGWPGRVGGLPPPVDARVRVAARDGARVLARVAGEPLLAEWSVGRGRVVALATDAWALDHEQWASLLAPAVAPRPREARISVEGDRLVYRGPPTDPPPGALTLRGPDGVHTGAWRLTGPGTAEAPLPPGPVAILDASAASSSGAVLDTVVRPPPAELRETGVDPGALALQAALTDGAVLDPAALDDPTTVTTIRASLGGTGGFDPAPLAALLALLIALADAARWAGYRFRRSRHS